MVTQAPAETVSEHAVESISVRILVGTNRMAATDDPLFLHLTGRCGREFRLVQQSGKSLRRGHEDTFILGPPDAPETSVSHPDLNDPTTPPIFLEGIDRVELIKRMEPLPNVRGLGEMDDRLLIEEVEVLVECAGIPPTRFYRAGPHWLGLVCGLILELPRVGPSRV